VRSSFGITSVMLLGLAIVSSPALAQERGHDRDHDRDDRKEWRDHDRDRDRDEHRSHVRHVRDDDGRHGDHDRDDWRGDRDHDRRPPGWNHGRKKGWGNCDLPPGQARKHGCDSDDDHDRPTIVTHRPITRHPITHKPTTNRPTPISHPVTTHRGPSKPVRRPVPIAHPVSKSGQAEQR
jgi:hypothetical protein